MQTMDPGGSRDEIVFDEDQELLARSAADLMRNRSAFEAVRASLAAETGYDAALFEQVAELGFVGIALPQAHGGAGLAPGALVAVMEAMGRHLYAGPFVATTLAGQLLARLPDPKKHAEYLPQLARGSMLGAVALCEPEGGYDPLSLATTASTQAGGQDYQLDGTKTGVLDAAHADLLLVSAQTGDGPGVFAVRRAALPDGAVSREHLVDETRRSYRITLRGTPAVRVARDASEALTHVHQLGALLMAADMSGGTLGCMALTLDYLQTRTQFGKPIGGYQALKHPMVDIMVASEQGRSLLYHAATVFDGASQQSERATRMAKAHCGEAFTRAADRSIQFHGAIGFTYECHAQLFFRRAQWAEYQFGDNRHHRRHLQALLL